MNGVAALGAFPLPLEVIPFGLEATRQAIENAAGDLNLAGEISLRTKAGMPFVTDNGNHVFDASFGRIPDPEALADRLDRIPGVVEHGLFLGYADLALIASPGGVVELKA